MEVIKRDGREVDFDKTKIRDSVLKAYMEVDGESIDSHARDKATEIGRYVESLNKDLTVEEIQDIVENKLMASNRKDVARAYIIYRSTRSRARDRNSAWVKAIKNKVLAKNVVNQNANVDEHSFGGRRGEADAEMLRKMALDDYMSEMSRENHLSNEIYIHDLSDYVLGDHNCLTCPVDVLLEKGFVLRQTDIRPAQSIGTAFQLLAVIFQVQSLQQFGGVSEGHLDHTMVPYVKKSFAKHYLTEYLKQSDDFNNLNLIDLYFDSYTDEAGIERNKLDDWIDSNTEKIVVITGLDVRDIVIDNKSNLDIKLYQSALYDTILELRQAVEGMYHNLNSLQSRSGNQLPFSSINYGTCTKTEGRLVTKAILEMSIKGVGMLHKTSIFPCGIFQYMKGINNKPGTPNYDLFRLALKSTAKRLYPNYCNVDWSNNAGYDINDPKTYMSTMGERILQPILNLLNLARGCGDYCLC